jgi:hypothetical protein
MGTRSDAVDAFLAALEHPRRDEVQRLRDAILGSDGEITESVKWNAPNFRFGGEDRVTFRLRPGDRVQLVFHRGAKVRGDSAAFRFDDPSGLLEWAAPDRGVLTLVDAGDTAAKQSTVVELVRRWVRT